MSHIVKKHYNARPDQGLQGRQKSPIIHLRSLNNFIKSLLISQCTPSNAVVLDIACGKGGDLQKWKSCRIQYLLGLDIADLSIEQATSRYNTSRFPFKAKFIALDCFTPELEKELVDQFDVVSIQFALHYAFESEDKIRRFLKTISKHIRKGGRFFGTIPYSPYLLTMLKHSKVFGNSVYNIEFTTTETTLYGQEYVFTLTDAIDSCPEYVVHTQVFYDLCKDYGLELEFHQPFHEFFYEQFKRDGKDSLALLERMKVLSDGGISKDEWEASGLYSCFSFIKK